MQAALSCVLALSNFTRLVCVSGALLCARLSGVCVCMQVALSLPLAHAQRALLLLPLLLQALALCAVRSSWRSQYAFSRA